MNKNKIKKFLSIIGTTTLVASPIIAMAGRTLLSISNRKSLNETNADNIVMNNWTEITCNKWVSSASGNKTLWTCSTEQGDIVLTVESDKSLFWQNTSLLKKDPNETGFIYYLDLSSITGATSLDGTFSECVALKGCIIPEGVTEFKNLSNYYGVFRGCTALTEVIFPDNVTEIGPLCFYGCTSLTQITIPDTVTYIGYSCFSGCTALTQVTIPNTITELNSNCFYGCSSLTQITIPDTVTLIDSSCFEGCSSLTQITIPDTVTNIKSSCFQNCTSLTQITIPEVLTSLERSCFKNCTSLTQITIPDNVKEMGESCFENCTSISQATIRTRSITTLPSKTFKSCTSLSRINFLTKDPNLFLADNTCLDTKTNTEVYFGSNSLYEKYSPSNGTGGWAEGSGWTADTTITFTKYYYDNFSPSESSKTINIQQTATNLSLGTFTIDNSNVLDTSEMYAEITDWTAINDTTSDGISLSVVKDDSDESHLKYKVIATWNDNQFTKIDNITFSIRVYDADNRGVAGTDSDAAYSWTVSENDDLTNITISSDSGDSKVINDWDRDTAVTLTATPNSGANPDLLNGATWSLSGQTSNGKISVSGTGANATLTVAKDLPQGTYNVTIQCIATNDVTGTLSYTITKNYVDLSSITITAEGGNTMTTDDWANNKTVTLTATANNNTDPNLLSSATWSISNDYSNGKISVSGTGTNATLTIDKDLPVGTYAVTIQCTATNDVTGTLSYTIKKKNVSDSTIWSKFMWLWILIIVLCILTIVIVSVVIARNKKRRKIKNLDKEVEKLMK